MHSDYKVGRCSRRCDHLNRPLEPGEWYYSVVREGDDEETLVRSDISAQAWQGPPEGTLGWWKSRMPEEGARKLRLAPDAVLVDLLRDSEPGEGESSAVAEPLRYLLALMLLRRRIVRPSDPTRPSTDDNPLELEVVSDGSITRVRTTRITPSEARRLGDQLVELLYCDSD